MPRADPIEMSTEEIHAYLREQNTVILTTNGPRGHPHAVAMFYALDEPEAPGEPPTIRFATYRSSQKVRNIERDPKVCLLVESGSAYDELRGVMMEGIASISTDLARTVQTMIEANAATGSPLPPIDSIPEAVQQRMAGKRVLVSVRPTRFASWDHGKLPRERTPQGLRGATEDG
jgi:general stress protein 26